MKCEVLNMCNEVFSFVDLSLSPPPPNLFLVTPVILLYLEVKVLWSWVLFLQLLCSWICSYIDICDLVLSTKKIKLKGSYNNKYIGVQNLNFTGINLKTPELKSFKHFFPRQNLFIWFWFSFFLTCEAEARKYIYFFNVSYCDCGIHLML